jgi:hypothetical protein
MTYTINETTYSEGEYQQMQNLIRKYADANKKEYQYNGTASAYWRGVRDTYQTILNETFDGDWSTRGSIGWYVFMEQQDYLTAKESYKQNKKVII